MSLSSECKVYLQVFRDVYSKEFCREQRRPHANPKLDNHSKLSLKTPFIMREKSEKRWIFKKRKHEKN